MDAENSLTHTYFAKLPKGAEYAAKLWAKVEDGYEMVSSCGIIDVWGGIHAQMFKGLYTLGDVEIYGVEQNKRKIDINRFRKNVIQRHQILSQNRPRIKARAKTSDWEGIKIAKKGNLFAANIMRENRNEESVLGAEWDMSKYAEGWTLTELKEGMGVSGIVIKKIFPWDVVRDAAATSIPGSQWFIVRETKLRSEWIQEHPDYANEIDALSDTPNGFWEGWWLNRFKTEYDRDGEYLTGYTLYHRPKGVVEKGRKTTFFNANLIVYDGELPVFPLTWRCDDYMDGLPFGYGPPFDGLVLQKCFSSLASFILTRIVIFGAPTLVAEDDSGFDIESMMDGHKWVKYTKGSALPQLLDNLKVPRDLTDTMNMMAVALDANFGITDVDNGNLPGGEKVSGVVIQSLESKSVRFNSGGQASLGRAQEEVGTIALQLECLYGNDVIEMKSFGKNNKYLIDKVYKKDLEQIEKYDAEIVNPMFNTDEGRRQLLAVYQELGFITKPEDVANVLETGRIEVITDKMESEGNYYEEIRDMLLSGRMPTPRATDNHFKLTQIALQLLNTFSAKDNSELLVLLDEFYKQEKSRWQMMTPEELMLHNAPPFPLPPVLPQGVPPQGVVPAPANIPPVGSPPAGGELLPNKPIQSA